MNASIFALFFLFLLSSASQAQSSFRNATADFDKGDKLYSEERYKEALREYQRLPVSVEAHKRIGAAQIKLWDMNAAIASLRKAVALAERDSEALALLAEALSWKGEFDEASALYRRALADKSAPVSVRLGYARTLSWSKDIDGALEQYRIATREFPRNLDALMGLAEMLSWKKQFDASIESYRRVAELTDVSAYKSVALSRVGKVQTWKGDMKAAKETYQRALRLNAKNPDALFGLGELHEWEGNYPEAKALYQRILQAQPEHKAAKAKLMQLLWVK